jgi:Tfp pilus assembly protein PilO
MATEAAMKIENRQQFLVVLTIAVAALFVGERLIYEPLANVWTARSQKIAALRKQVDDGKQLLKREQTIRSRWDQMRTNTLPADTSLAEQQVLKAFDNWSQDSSASITSITPQWNSDATNCLTVDLRVEASGDLGTLTQFLYDIEKGPMALKLESVDLSARDDTGQQLTLGLQISGLALTSQTK